MILNDTQIADLATEEEMIVPYHKSLIREVGRTIKPIKVLSYGQSSYGYDVSLSSNQFQIFYREHWIDKLIRFLKKPFTQRVIDPKKFDKTLLYDARLNIDETGAYFILPPYSYALGHSVERFNMPPDVSGFCYGKSTYARCGIDVTTTPIEAGWKGWLTIEMSNTTPSPVKIYADEGILQVCFFRGEPCATSYADRNGKYQNQERRIYHATV
jgi:dCTP deaminase